MLRLSLVCVALLIASCASVRDARAAVAYSDMGQASALGLVSSSATEASAELECMSDCVASGEESFEMCVVRCIE